MVMVAVVIDHHLLDDGLMMMHLHLQVDLRRRHLRLLLLLLRPRLLGRAATGTRLRVVALVVRRRDAALLVRVGESAQGSIATAPFLRRRHRQG